MTGTSVCAIAATLGLPRALVIPTAWSALHVVNTETLRCVQQW